MWSIYVPGPYLSEKTANIMKQGWKSCIQLTILNLDYIKMVEATGLKIIISRSP
jgi:hypothetical protein